MPKHHRLLLAAAAAATIAVTSITAASASPRAHPTAPGTEYIQVMSTSTTSSPASAIAHGLFTAAGQAHLGDAKLGTITFPGGTIMLSHAAQKGTSQFDPKTCLAIISQPGTYTIIGGTGKYAGITGHGNYHLSLVFIAARSHGQCSSNQAPVARQELLRLSGPARL